jgi:uncharacterized protein YkwD
MQTGRGRHRAVCKSAVTGKTVRMRMIGGLLLLGLACPSRAASAEPLATIDREGLSIAILAETNRERIARGLNPLFENPRLARAANGHTKFLVLIGGIRHESFLPGRQTVEDRVRAEKLRVSRVGENLAILPVQPRVSRTRVGGGSIKSVLEEKSLPSNGELAAMLVRAWMDSPGHRENLLNPKFTHLGCAVQTGIGPGSGMVVFSAQVFARL